MGGFADEDVAQGRPQANEFDNYVSYSLFSLCQDLLTVIYFLQGLDIEPVQLRRRSRNASTSDKTGEGRGRATERTKPSTSRASEGGSKKAKSKSKKSGKKSRTKKAVEKEVEEEDPEVVEWQKELAHDKEVVATIIHWIGMQEDPWKLDRYKNFFLEFVQYLVDDRCPERHFKVKKSHTVYTTVSFMYRFGSTTDSSSL